MSDAEDWIGGLGLKHGLPDAAPGGDVLWAEHQTEGVGRKQGRSWDTPPGEGLLFTIILDKDTIGFASSLFPIVTGLALALYLEDAFCFRPVIKWPNDLLLPHRGKLKKAAGILCRLKRQYYVLGVGINCTQDSFSGGLAETAVSLKMAAEEKSGCAGLPINREVLLNGFLRQCKKAFQRAAVEKSWRAAVRDRLLFSGQRVVVRERGGEEVENLCGVIEGIGPEGELLLRTVDNVVNHVFTGEVEKISAP